ncbi:contractile injection system protein, VgrG/Pvc8 family [Pseudoalteromonas gelatinilytica]|uniref:contractile injection system protein, VgrG/Pvc8 family n=1 Tax=Pseudoalteromonas gelatinilytica TaxID=1703256 RepID=UPI0007C56850|nr:contractile injection system protein, VgrG/Pvc8 family [Pseudoalteromonas gelatinilytica]
MSNSRLLIDVNNITLNVTRVDGIEQLNQGFEFIIIGESSQQILLEHLLLQSALITFVNKDNFFRHLAGIIFECDNLGTFKGKYRYKIVIKDRLSTLKNITNSKVFIGVNLKDVIFYLAGQAGYSPGQIDFRVGSSLPALPQCVQAMETNWHFLQRLLTQFGLFIWFETKNNVELLVISDSNLNSPYLQRGIVSVQNSAGMNNDDNTAYVGFFNSQVHHSIYNDRTDCVAHGQYLKVASNSQSYFEPCASTPSAASLQAQDFSNALASLNKTTQLVGNVCDLFAGSSVAIDDQTGTGSSADLLCVSVYHSSEQPNDENSHQGLTRYSCKAQFIERGTPFKAKPLPHQAKPMVFPAKVESLTTSSFIDDLGCYRVRTDFDTTARPIAQSSQAIQQLALYACQNQPQATGWHFPLVGGSEVLIGCINNDPNNTFLMGFAMNESQPSVVTAANNTQNRLVSAAQNELQFDDDKQAPKIILQTLASEHYLELNAKKSGRQFIEWISQLGTINLHAGKDLCLTTENDNIQFVIKNNQFIDVKNNVSLSTQNRDINMQSAGSQAWQGKNTLIESRQALSMVSGRAVKAFAQSDIQLKTSSSDLTISAPNGSTFLQTNQSIAITGSGRGDLILHNEGGEIKLDSQGNVEIIATDVLTLDGTFINFDGPVDYDIESPSTASAQSVNVSRAPAISSFDLADSSLDSTTLCTLDLSYCYLDGSAEDNIRYSLIDSLGHEHTGSLSNGKAQLANVPQGQSQVRFIASSDDDEQRLVALRNEFKQTLEAMLNEVRQKAAIEDALFEQESLFNQYMIELGANATGFYQGAKSLIEGVADLIVLGIDINISVYSACFRIIEAIARGDKKAVKYELETIISFSQKSAQSLTQACELLYILLDDEQTRLALARFPYEYIDAHSHVEQERLTGILAFEVVLALLTGGVGAAASLASKSRYLAKANKALTQIAEIVKRKQLNKQLSHAVTAEHPTVSAKITKPDTQLQPSKNHAVATHVSAKDHAEYLLLTELSDDMRGNYRAYTNSEGKVIISRLDGKKPPKLRYENGNLVPVSDQINVFNKIAQKLKINHANLSDNIKQRLKQFEAARNQAVAKRDAALLAGNATALKEAQSAMRLASEALGEEAARIYVKQNYPDATPLASKLPGKGKQGQFDQVYATEDGKVLIIEAKGGNASWGSRVAGEERAQQGSEKYMNSIIENYTSKLDTLTKDPRYIAGDEDFVKEVEGIQDMLDEIEIATKSQQIEYVGIQQKANDAGLVDVIDVSIFDIGF